MESSESIMPVMTEPPKTWKTFLHDNRLTIVGVMMVLGFIAQGYFMYLTATSARSRNLVIVQKAPFRIIARWDSFADEGSKIEVVNANIAEREMWYQTAKAIPYVDYRFNENLYIRINTLDIKTKEAKVNLNEASSISDSDPQE